MHAHAGAVNHLDVAIVSLCDGVHNPVPDAGLGPAAEAVVAGRRRAVATGQISPRRAGTQNPEDAVQNPAIIHPGNPAGLPWQQRLDNRPLKIREIVACHDKLLSFRSLNHNNDQMASPFMSLRPSSTKRCSCAGLTAPGRSGPTSAIAAEDAGHQVERKQIPQSKTPQQRRAPALTSAWERWVYPKPSALQRSGPQTEGRPVSSSFVFPDPKAAQPKIGGARPWLRFVVCSLCIGFGSRSSPQPPAVLGRRIPRESMSAGAAQTLDPYV